MRLTPHQIPLAIELQASRYTRALDAAQAMQSVRKATKHTNSLQTSKRLRSPKTQ